MEAKNKNGTGINCVFIYLSERLNIIFAVNDKNSGIVYLNRSSILSPLNFNQHSSVIPLTIPSNYMRIGILVFIKSKIK